MIILGIIYLISAILMWLYVHLAYSAKGIGSSHLVSGEDVFMVICPFINTVGLISYLTNWPIKRNRRRYISYKKFFLIK